MKRTLFFLPFVMLVVSCSFTRKVENAYELAANTNPITSKDTLNAIKIAKKFTPKEKLPKVLPGKTVRVPYPVFKNKLVLDSGLIERITDSLLMISAEDINQTVDECIANERKAKREGISQGIKEGYEKRNKELERDSAEIKLPDIPIPTDDECDLERKELEIKIRESNAKLIAAEAKKDTYKWLFFILLGMIVMGGVFGIKKLLTPKMPIK